MDFQKLVLLIMTICSLYSRSVPKIVKRLTEGEEILTVNSMAFLNKCQNLKAIETLFFAFNIYSAVIVAMR